MTRWTRRGSLPLANGLYLVAMRWERRRRQCDGEPRHEAALVDPLLAGVGAAAGHRADGVGGDAEREGNVRVGGGCHVRGFGAEEGRTASSLRAVRLPSSSGVHVAVSGAHADDLEPDACAVALVACDHGTEPARHLVQAVTARGTELEEGTRVLGDGVDRGAAPDGSDVHGGALAGGQLERIEVVDDRAEVGDGVALAEVRPRVPASGVARDAVAVRARRAWDDAREVGVEGGETRARAIRACR